ncbi:uncharacterized protein [Paramisgurnus dabryanus]|uniref:uncharacterized protein isoform X2 n=1 Tax=Paramisgurnus dabryanus TaxID=90735 RepID=UPI003CCF2239
MKDNNSSPYTTTTLHTIRVFAEPPGGVLVNRFVVLTCEVSDVTDSVMLAWLRMDGDRGVLVKQQILNEKNFIRHLTVNVNSIQSDQLHWQCAVFTENKLKALAPITISLISNYPVHAIVITAVTLCAGILLGVLVYYWYRKQMSGMSADGRTTTIHRKPEESEPVYVNLRRTRIDRVRSDRRQGTRNDRPEIHSHLPRNNYGESNIVRRDETPVTPESITYAAIFFKEPRLKT